MIPASGSVQGPQLEATAAAALQAASTLAGLANAAPAPTGPNPMLVVPSTPLRPPVGVQEIGNMGNGNYLTLVSQLDWRLFSSKADADALLAVLASQLGISATVIEDGEEGSRFEFADAQSGPRVYAIIGTDSQGNFFYEVAGDILARRQRPDLGVDQGAPYKPGDVLTMSLEVGYGYAEFFWKK